MKVNNFVILLSLGMIAVILIITMLLVGNNNVDSFVESSYIINPAAIQENMILSMITNFNPSLSGEEKRTICTMIINQSTQTSLDPFLITGVVATESSFVPKALSPCRARGLMQVTSGVTDPLHITNPFDIEQNIYAGTHYLKYLQQRFIKEELALAAYNAGPAPVATLGAIPPYIETINYVQKVISLRNMMQKSFKITLNKLLTQPIFTPMISTINGKLVIKVATLKRALFGISLSTQVICESDYRFLRVFFLT